MRKKADPFIFTFLLALTAGLAHAGPWLVAPQKGKIIYTDWHEEAPNRPFMARDLRQIEGRTIGFEKLHIEYGLTPRFAVQGIIQKSRRQIGHGEDSDGLGRLGVMSDAPLLQTGLLPPYVYKGLGKLFGRENLHRDKRATFGWSMAQRDTDFANQTDTTHGRVEELAIGDKIRLGRFSVMQTLENTKTRMSGVDWRQNLYRFELGWRDRFALGSEAHFFEDRNSPYAALTHMTTLSHVWPSQNIRLKLMLGKKRETGLAKSNISVLELEKRF